MNKRLKAVPQLQKDLIMDQATQRWTSTQGQSQWEVCGRLTTKNGRTTGYALSAQNCEWLLDSIPLIDPINAFYKGRSSFIQHSWELVTRMTNISNCPVEVECFTIKAKKLVDMNTDADTGRTSSNTVYSMLQRQFYAQYGVDTVTNPEYGPAHPAFKLSDVRDFGQYFKVIRHKRRVVQPGEALRIRKFMAKPRVFNTVKWYNAASAEYTAHMPKGALCYIYRITGIPQTQASSIDVTLCDAYMDVAHTLHTRISIMPYNRYDANNASGQLPTGQTLKVIFPGTSAAGTSAPAT